MTTDTAAVILAGGLARRMGGGDKCRVIVGGRTVLDRTIATIGRRWPAWRSTPTATRPASPTPPCRCCPTLCRATPARSPASSQAWTGPAATGAVWLLSVPGDCPFLPSDLAARLHQARGAATYAVAASGGWTHPVVALWPVDCRDELRAALAAGERKIDAFTACHPVARAEWPADPHDPFLNLNTQQDLDDANAALPR